MLKEMLKTIYDKGYFSHRTLAEQLNTTEDLVSSGISQLVRMGYIHKEEQDDGCFTACAGCPFAQSCHKKIVQTYQLTQKGRAII